MGIIKDPTSWRAGFELGLAGFSFPYSKPRKPTAYLYNGIRLPALPVVDGYDYAFMTLALSASGEYYYGQLTLSTKPMEYTYLVLPTDYLVATEDCSYIQYTINDGNTNGIWDFYGGGDVAQGSRICFVSYDNNWANHDIPNIKNGGTFLVASAPVPVYE